MCLPIFRLFAPKRCSRCQQMISGQELVIRVQADDIYHVDCFVCSVCERQLRTGDRFGVQNSLIFCQLHYGMLAASAGPAGPGGTDGRSSNQTTVPDEVLASPSAFSRDASSSFSPPPSLQAPPLQPTSAVIQRGSFFNGSTSLHKGRPRKRKMVSLAPHESIDIFGQKFGKYDGRCRTSVSSFVSLTLSLCTSESVSVLVSVLVSTVSVYICVSMCVCLHP